MMKGKNNQNGFTLLWGVVVLMVMAILVGGLLTLGYTYVNRSINNNENQQAYFSARSAVDAVASQLWGKPTNEKAAKHLIPEVGKSIAIDKLSFQNSTSNMGSTEVKVTREDEDHLLINAVSQVGRLTSSVALRLLRQVETVPTSGLVCKQLTNLSGTENRVEDLVAEPGCDLYLMGRGVEGTTFAGGTKLCGNLYANSDLSIEGDKDSPAHVHRAVKSTGSVMAHDTTIGYTKGDTCGLPQMPAGIYANGAVTLGKDASVHQGGVMAKRLSLDLTASVEGNVRVETEVSGNKGGIGGEIQNGTVSVDIPNPLVEETEILSNLPPYSGGSVKLGQYAVMSDWMTPDGNLSIEPSENPEDTVLEIYVPDGETLNIDSMENGDQINPNLNIYLGKGSTFLFNQGKGNETFIGNVYGWHPDPNDDEEAELRNGSTAIFGDNTHIVGLVAVTKVEAGKNVTFSMPGYISGGGSGGEITDSGFVGIVAEMVVPPYSGTLNIAGENTKFYYMSKNKDTSNLLGGPFHIHLKGDFYSSPKIAGYYNDDFQMQVDGNVYSRGTIELPQKMLSQTGNRFPNTNFPDPDYPRVKTIPSDALPLTNLNAPLGKKNAVTHYDVRGTVGDPNAILRTVDGAGDIYIYLENGRGTLMLQSMERKDAQNTPNVYIVLGNNTQLVLNPDGVPNAYFHGYVMRKNENGKRVPKSQVVISSQQAQSATEFDGAIETEELIILGPLNFTYVPPMGSSSGGPGGGPGPLPPEPRTIVSWKKLQYLEGREDR